jgi:outer membrane protein assembly factor BamB
MSDAVTQFHSGTPLSDPTPPAALPDVSQPTPAVVRPRLWPAVVILALMWAVTVIPGFIGQLQGTPWHVFAMIWGAGGGAIAIGLWWLFASRVPWTDRLMILLFFAVSSLAARPLSDPSFLYFNYGPITRGLPLTTTVLVLWLLVTPALSWPVRRLGAVAALLLAWGYCDLVRLDGVWGDFKAEVHWRWEPTAEQKYIASISAKTAPAVAEAEGDKPLQLAPGDWPAFRGTNRDGRLTGVRIASDWYSHPPRKLWGHLIGPGWSSFAVVGHRIYTQEQRDQNEAVVCYDANTGVELWAHLDAVRFSETVAGPGPRSTPTFHEGKLYALGAKGVLNCLDPVTGKLKWSRNIVTDSGAEVPMWGFSSSPLVAQDVVTVFAGAPGKSVLGYHASSGESAWSAGEGTKSYCSPQLMHLGGVDQVVISTNKGLTAFEPADGKVLWQHDWSVEQAGRVAQPALVGEGDLLIGTAMVGARRVHVGHEGDGWTEGQVWETKDIKPYYNDLVVYQDHAYGFDGNFFTCVSLADGKSKWRARGYGNGQALLLADQGLLLILSEKGDVALVEATPDKHKELARFKAIEGKTWNHPVLAHGKLFVRNGEQVACFQIAEEKGDGKGDTKGNAK